MTKKMKKIKSEATIESPIMIVSGAKSTPGHKNIRKTSETQKDLMIEYFETHDGAIDVVSANNTDAEVKRRIWSEVAEILNKVEGGTKKNDLKWAKTWADMKLYTKNRARAAKQGTVQGSARKPSDHDRRVLRVTGHEDLLQDWDTSLLEGDITGATTYEKIRVDDTEHEIVVTEGTDYEYIEEEEMGENTQEIVRIQPYYETETQYEYSEPVQVFKVEPKRKRNEEDTEMIEMHEVEQQQTTSTPKKRQKTDTEDEEQTQDASFQEERRSNSSESMAAAINNLANALHSVASALTSFADAAKTFNR